MGPDCDRYIIQIYVLYYKELKKRLVYKEVRRVYKEVFENNVYHKEIRVILGYITKN